MSALKILLAIIGNLGRRETKKEVKSRRSIDWLNNRMKTEDRPAFKKAFETMKKVQKLRNTDNPMGFDRRKINRRNPIKPSNN